jgi:hypothetical protein
MSLMSLLDSMVSPLYISKLALTCGLAWRFWWAQSLDGQTGGRTWDRTRMGVRIALKKALGLVLVQVEITFMMLTTLEAFSRLKYS